MKPKNATLGASPLRVSRVTDIDVDNKAWDSVVFQQSKSLLDFDLNVMQRIMQDSIRKLSQSLVPSGFVSTVKIFQPVSNNSIIYLAPNRVSVSGTILRLIDPNGDTKTIDTISYPKCIKIDSSLYNDGTLSATNSVFVWIESWFQEIVPSLVDESFDGVSTVEKKLTTVYQYGNDPNTYETNFPSGNIATNELKDTTFGAETTRRIQVRWRIRLSPKINSNTYTTGFSDTNGTSSNSLIWPQGGRKNCVFSATISSTTMNVTAVTSGYVAIGMTITGPGIPDNTYVSAFQSGATGGVGNYTISYTSPAQPVTLASRTVFGWFTKSYTFARSDKLTDTNANDFVLDSDQNVYIAGSGSPSDALALNTVDGRVYGIPLGFFTSTNTFVSIAPNSSPQNALGTVSATSVSLGINNLRLNANSIGIASTTGQSPTAGSGPLTVDTGTGTVTFNSPLAIGGTSLVSATTFNASAPALRFAGTGNPSSSGLYYDSNASADSGVMISDKGTLVAAFNKDGGLSVQNNLPINAKYLKVSGFYSALTTPVNFASGRYLGTWDGINSGAFTAPINANLSAGDFVINTGGYLHIYTGTAWVLGGTNTGQPNTWSALNTFSTGGSYTLSANASQTLNLLLSNTTVTFGNIAASHLRTVQIGQLPVATSGTGTLSDASALHIANVPTGSIITDSYGILIDTGTDAGNTATTKISGTNAYGLYVRRPQKISYTGNETVLAARFVSDETSMSTNVSSVQIDATDTSTTGTSVITKTGLSVNSTGNWKVASGLNKKVNRALYVTATDGDLNYAAIFDTGQVGINTTSPTSGFSLDVGGSIRANSGITIATGNLTLSNASSSFTSSEPQSGNWIANSISATNQNSTSSTVYTKTALNISSTGTWTNTAYVANDPAKPPSINRALYVTASGGNVNYAAIFDGGSVGIGTTSPSAILHTYGAVRFSQPTGGATGGSPFDFTQYNDDLYLKMYRPANTTQHSAYYMQMGIAGLDGGALSFRRSTAAATIGAETMADVLTMRSDGKVGIGTNSPGFPLDVQYSVAGNSVIQIYNENTETTAQALFLAKTKDGSGTQIGQLYKGLGAGGTAFINNIDNGPMWFGTYNTERVRITSSGNVGIGTNSPSATFHVVGTVAGAVASRTFIPAQGFNLPTSGFPAFSQRNTGSVKYELQYAYDADQWSYTTVIIPSNWSGTTITFKLNWYTASINQSVVWRIQAAVSGNGMNPNPNLSTITTFTPSANGASLLKTESFTWNPTSGTVSAGNILYIGVGRLGTDTSDTSQETINFHSLAIEF